MQTDDNTAIRMSSLKQRVAPGKFPIGYAASPGSDEYRILLDSLNSRSDRGWWPPEAPDLFVCKAAPGKWNTKNRAWFPVFAGVEYEWSYLKGFTGAVLPSVAQAARFEVEGQIEPLRRPGMHVHHAETSFNDLFSDFLSRFGLSTADICVRVGGKSGEAYFENPYFSAFWRLFHLKNATLEVVSVEDHKAIHSGRRSDQ